MPLESNLVRRVIEEQGRRSDCSIYISIILAYMEEQKWEDARMFLKLAYQTRESYEEQVSLRFIGTILQSENVEESKLLLTAIKSV